MNGTTKVAELTPAHTPEELMAASETGFEELRGRWGDLPSPVHLEVFAPSSGNWVQPIYKGQYRAVEVRWGLQYLNGWVERFDWCLAAVANEARLEAMTPR